MRDADGARTDYLYDAVGRLIGISAPSSDYFAFGYDRGGRLTERWAPNGVHSEYAYNHDGTLASIEHAAGGEERARHAYTYDAWGNRVEHAEALLGAEVQYTFVYDELDRLIQETGPGGPLKYRYDILGNRTRLTLPDNTYSTYVYDTLNQLLRIDEYNAANLKQRTAASFTYDPAGNLLSRTEAALSQTLTWSPANQLASVSTRRTLAGATTEYLEHYAYDHQGRRIARSIGAHTTEWLYHGPDIYTEHRGDWSQATERHTHGPASDDPLLVENALGRFYYHPDGRGSLSLLTDEAASGWVLRRYGAWGTSAEAREAGAAFTPRYGYTGREQDETSGLMYYRARYYDPAIGRFISRDPIGLANGDISPYLYAANNPVLFTDSYGLLPQVAARPSSYWSQINGTTRLAGAFGALGGGAEAPTGGVTFALGLGASTSGIGAAVGIPAMVGGGLVASHGLDTLQAGVRQLWTGKVTDTLTSQGLQALGASPTTAGLIDTGMGIGGSLGMGSLARGTERALMSGLTDDVVARFAANPAQAAASLSARQSTAARNNPGLTAPFFGVAIENQVTRRLADNPILDATFSHLSAPGRIAPDFVSRLTGQTFDITTNNARSFSEHLMRPYGQGLNIVPYYRPAGFVFP